MKSLEGLRVLRIRKLNRPKSGKIKIVFHNTSVCCIVFDAPTMVAQEISNIAVCATVAADLEGLIQAVRAAGSWGIVAIEWPDAAGLAAAQETAHAFLLRSAPGKACEKL